MDRKEFEIAVEAAGEVHRLTMFLLQDPPGSLAAVAMREFDGAILPAWIQEAEDPERRSKIAARAVNQIDPTRHVQAATRQGPHPERDASRKHRCACRNVVPFRTTSDCGRSCEIGIKADKLARRADRYAMPSVLRLGRVTRAPNEFGPEEPTYFGVTR